MCSPHRFDATTLITPLSGFCSVCVAFVGLLDNLSRRSNARSVSQWEQYVFVMFLGSLEARVLTITLTAAISLLVGIDTLPGYRHYWGAARAVPSTLTITYPDVSGLSLSDSRTVPSGFSGTAETQGWRGTGRRGTTLILASETKRRVCPDSDKDSRNHRQG